MDVSANPNDIRSFASQMRQWASQMKGTQSNIQSRTRSLETSWKDPQYRMFVETAKTQGIQLKAAIEQFEKMSVELTAIAAQLESAKRDSQARINRMGR